MASNNSEHLIDIVGVEAIDVAHNTTFIVGCLMSLIVAAVLLWMFYRYKRSDKGRLAALVKLLKAEKIPVKKAAQQAYAIAEVKQYCAENEIAYQQLQCLRFSKQSAQPEQLLNLLNPILAQK